MQNTSVYEALREQVLPMVDKTSCDKALAHVNAVMGQAVTTAKAFNDAMASLNKEVQAYNVAVEAAYIDEFLTSPSPMKTAIEAFYYPTLAVKPVTVKDDDGNVIITSYDLAERDKMVDLKKVCTKGKLSLHWYHCMENAARRVAFIVAGLIDMDAKERQGIMDKWGMTKEAQALKDGINPGSKTQVKKVMQEAVDDITKDFGDGITYEVRNEDYNFVLAAFGKLSNKAPCTIIASTNGQMARIFMNMLFAMITKTQYVVEYKQAKQKDVTPATAPAVKPATNAKAPAKAKAPKAKKAAA